MKPEIIFEDNQLLAINKPAGLLVHPTPRQETDSVWTWLFNYYPQLRLVGEPIKLATGAPLDRYGLLHRLDKETSGLLLIAKTADAFSWYKQLFQSRRLKKIYRAIVYGSVEPTEGVIEFPLGRSRRDPARRAAGAAAKGVLRSAVTHYHCLKKSIGYSYLELEPKTGRTHQLRVHLKTLGYPIVCDEWYAPKKVCPPELGRLGLHAFSLEFYTPANNRLKLEADLPTDFQTALAALGLAC